VGSHVHPRLLAAGFVVRSATREPEQASRARPGLDWVELDVDRSATLEPALRDVKSAIYLVHGMGAGPGYEERERASARAFAAAAAKAGVERIIYLGAVAPKGRPSRHLSSRLETGKILRGGPVPVFELRAGMIIGHGSISWQIVRDLAARLPAMLLPRWLESRSQPLAIDDVVEAIVATLTLPLELAGVHDLPGPETLTAKEILFRIAGLRGTRPVAFSVPVLSPRLSSYWLKFVTGADYHVARELVDGLSSDLIAPDSGLWRHLPDHRLVPFDEAARRAMAEHDQAGADSGNVVERAVVLMSKRPATR